VTVNLSFRTWYGISYQNKLWKWERPWIKFRVTTVIPDLLRNLLSKQLWKRERPWIKFRVTTVIPGLLRNLFIKTAFKRWERPLESRFRGGLLICHSRGLWSCHSVLWYGNLFLSIRNKKAGKLEKRVIFYLLPIRKMELYIFGVTSNLVKGFMNHKSKITDGFLKSIILQNCLLWSLDILKMLFKEKNG